MLSEKNCIDVVRPFVDELEARDISNVQLFGGIGSAALENPDVQIIPDEKLVVAPSDLTLSTIRDNGTRRDLDALMLTTNQADVTSIEALAAEIVGDDLEVSVFGMKPAEQLAAQVAHPWKSLASVWVSDRYADIAPDGKILAATKALFPFAVELDLESLETWRLQIGSNEATVPIPHPGATVLNYLTRSCGGLRPKDAAKVGKIAQNVGNKAPEVIDWIVDGPGRSQMTLARLLHTWREPHSASRSTLTVGESIQITPYAETPVMGLEGIVELDGSHLRRSRVLRAAHAKARLVHTAERQDHIVAYWQENIEPRIKPILRNDVVG